MPFTIVTPSFNLARFLPEAIESVLSQDVPGLDYCVADGGSTDGSLDILHRYSSRLRWTAAPDGGCANALRAAFATAPGDLLGWLAADDILLPGALAAAQDAFDRHPEAVAVFSGANWIDEHGHLIRPYPVASDADGRLGLECLICQPACFFRASAYHAAGGIDSALASAFDYDLWIRLARLGPFVYQPGTWALSRMRRSSISLGQRAAMFRENIHLLARHFGYVPFNWIYCRRVYRRDGRDQFFEPLQPSLSDFLASLPEGLLINRAEPRRYLREWSRHLPILARR